MSSPFSWIVFHLVCINPFPLHLSLIFNCSPFSPCFPKSNFTQPPLLPLSTSPPCLFTNRLSRDPFHSSLEGLQIRCVLEVCCNFLGKIVSKIDMCPEKGALSRGKIIFQPLFYSGVASRGDTNVSSQLHLLRTILLGYFCRKKIPNLPSRWASTSYKWSPSINGLINDGYLGF